MVGSGMLVGTAAMPKPGRRPLGQTGGSSMPTSAVILAIFWWAVACDQGQSQRGLPVAFAGATAYATCPLPPSMGPALGL